MNKKVMAIVAVIALVAILGICLVACNAESVSKKLEKKDYTVIALSENTTDATGKMLYKLLASEDGFKEGLIASKGTSEGVIVIWFNTTDAAKDFESDAKTSFAGMKIEKVSRVGKVVYAGTEQGVKDAK